MTVATSKQSNKTEKKARYSRKQALANEPLWSEYQTAIFDWVQNGSGNLRVGAMAGSGKSTVIVGIVNRLPNDAKVSIIAFNKHIVESMRSKVPTRITVTTAHAMGYATLNRYFRGEGLTVEENKYRKIARGLVDQLNISSIGFGKRDKDVRYKLTEFLSTLIRFCQSTLTEPAIDDLLQLISYYSLEKPDGWNLVLPLVQIALDKGEKIAVEQRIIDFGDQLWLLERLNAWPVSRDFLLIDEQQDASNAQLALYKKIARDGCRVIGVGDEKQCQPPNTMVRLVDGVSEKPISEIRPGDQVMTYDRHSTYLVNRGKVNEVGSRHYNGYLYGISAGGKKTWCTDSHKWLVKWNFTEDMPQKWVIYLMRRGDKYRIGLTQLFHSTHEKRSNSGKCFHLSNRMSTEKADAVWILSIHGTLQDALVREQVISAKFGLPEVTFREASGNVGSKRLFTQEAIDRIFEDLHPQVENAVRCLAAHGRNINYPLLSIQNPQQRRGRTTVFETQACNLMPEFMSIPVAPDKLEIAGNSNPSGTGCDKKAIKKRRGATWAVLSVETKPYNGPVYSLDVNKYHKYIADGLVTCNSIMGFSGSTPDMWQRIQSEFSTIDLPLSVCYRCPTSHLDLARAIVPQIQSRPDAPIGSIAVLPPSEVKERVTSGDLVICRFTAPLVSLCLKLIVTGKQAKVRGRDIGAQLVALANKAGEGVPYPRFMEGLREYCIPQIEAFRENDEEGAADSLEDRFMAVKACHDEFGRNCGSLKQFCDRISALFTDEASPVILSTIHRAKGDEADRVFLLGCNLLPYTARSQRDWQVEQEICLTYVGITRAKQALFLVPIVRKNDKDGDLDALLKHPYGGLDLEPVMDRQGENALICLSGVHGDGGRGKADEIHVEKNQGASEGKKEAIVQKCIYTASYFEPQNHHGRLIGISRSVPKGFTTSVNLPFFTPSADLLKQWKDGGMSEAEYCAIFGRQLEENEDKARSWLESLGDEPVTLLCWERSGDFCHRNQVADFISRINIGCEVRRDTEMAIAPIAFPMAGSIHVGSVVGKKGKTGWRGEVVAIKGLSAEILWMLDESLSFIPLSELEAVVPPDGWQHRNRWRDRLDALKEVDRSKKSKKSADTQTEVWA